MNLANELAPFNLPPALSAVLLAQEQQLIQLNAEQVQFNAEREQLTEQVQQQAAELKYRELKIAALKEQLLYLLRMRYGVKSEALNAAQRDLFEETIASDIAAVEAAIAAAACGPQRPKFKPPRQPRTQAGRQPLPAHLTRHEMYHEPLSCQCGQCGNALVKIGEDISEQLDMEPAHFWVNRHHRPQYACRACETVTAAPVEPTLIEGGMATSAVLAWVMISKYVDHLPLYRVSEIATRSGVTLAQSTLSSWVGTIGFNLQPLADRLKALLLLPGVALHADETPVQQLDPGKGKTHRSYLWANRSNDLDDQQRQIVVFDYQTGRSGAHARHFLGTWQGSLMVDDYSGYKALFAQGQVIELGCWAHARRKFKDLYEANQSPIAAGALARIGVLYAVEAEAKDFTPLQRQALRGKVAQPLLKEFQEWLSRTLLKVPAGSGTAKALTYSLRRWEALTRYAADGLLPIDNNPIENCFRPIAIGKKNWLFTGSEAAGQRAAAIQTLLATAKLNGLDPYAWLKDTLEKLPTWPNSRIDELLPLKPIVKDQEPSV